jgi:hypothetical protein
MSLIAAPSWAIQDFVTQEEFKAPELTDELRNQIAAWRSNQVMLKGNADIVGVISCEMEQRKELAKLIFNNEVGTQYYDMGEGFKLKCAVTETHSLKGDVETVLAGFTEAEADMLISWKPSLNVAAYKALSPEQQAKFNGILEIKPGAPALEIIPPKTKKG